MIKTIKNLGKLFIVPIAMYYNAMWEGLTETEKTKKDKERKLNEKK